MNLVIYFICLTGLRFFFFDFLLVPDVRQNSPTEPAVTSQTSESNTSASVNEDLTSNHFHHGSLPDAALLIYGSVRV